MPDFELNNIKKEIELRNQQLHNQAELDRIQKMTKEAEETIKKYQSNISQQSNQLSLQKMEQEYRSRLKDLTSNADAEIREAERLIQKSRERLTSAEAYKGTNA